MRETGKRKTLAPLIDVPVPAEPDWKWEQSARRRGWKRVAGVDEAGRGPLAGPVVAAAVILPPGIEFAGLRDSKCLTPAERERLFGEITAAALCWAVGTVEPEEIDRVNILRATHLAMAQALAALVPTPCGALVDGLPVHGLPCPHRSLVRGDALCVSIAAASVVAKVTRDRMMEELDRRHPEYGFARHKGYSTPEHLQALSDHGPVPCHRRSFAPVAKCLEDDPVIRQPSFVMALDG